MKLIKSCIIAFSMYSKIPMPQFEWKEEDMKYMLCFFPWIGAVIGLCMIGWAWICQKFQIGNLAYLLIGTAIPILITGGFHVDGYMDTMDALHSYQSRERKLEILKDSHIGAFSVIMLVLYYLIYIAAFSEVRDCRTLLIIGIGFALSRCLSGIGVVTLQPAKKDGLLRTFADNAEKKKVLIALLVQLILVMAGMFLLSWCIALFVLMGAAGTFAYYRYCSYKEFGGITGDTAGYFVLLCEVMIVIMAVVGSRFM
ncbi:MAG: adenosylcobinamide-GDP ribazoletransferase [Lachnospiraceae bacterium]|nr:adenosylcobinamide-GDP ribazoletransferase [Lachnospiraceae bacterium]